MTMHILHDTREMEASSDYLKGRTARSLRLLSMIDETIESLSMVSDDITGLNAMFSARLDSLVDVEHPIPEEHIIPALEQSQDSMAEMHGVFSTRRKAAVRDPMLSDEDGVVDAYDAAINAVCELNNTIEKLRWAILEHNADMEPSSESLLVSDDEGIDSFFRAL